MGTRGGPFFPTADRRFKHLLLGKARGRTEGVPREEVKAPISTSGTLSDTVVYEDPADPAKKLHLPSLRLRTEGPNYDLRITQEAGRWSIRFGIEPFPAPELGEDARTPALAFTVPGARLTYKAPPLDKQLPASEIIPDDGGWTIGFDTDLAGKDEVLWALSSSDGIELVVTRSFRAAFPVASAPSEPIGELKVRDHRLVVGPRRVQVDTPTPGGRVRDHRTGGTRTRPRVRDHRGRTEARAREGLGKAEGEGPGIEVRTPRGRRRAVRVAPPARRVVATPVVSAAFTVRPSEVVRARPGTPTGPGPAVSSLRIPLIGRRAAAAEPPPAKLRLDMLEKFRDIAFDPGQVVVAHPSGGGEVDEVRYRETDSVLPARIPLRLEPAAHPGIFDGGSSRAPSFRSVRVMHPAGATGRSHVYFQDTNRPGTFHYLPDQFCLARTDTVPLRPAVVFRVDQGEEEAEARTVCTFRLVPRTDHDRLGAAVAELSRMVPPPSAGELAPEVTLEPVQTDATLGLGLPSGAELEAPSLDLVNGFVAQVILPFDKFQDVFAAMASSGELETLLRGTIDVTLGHGDGPDSGHALIPVDISFASASRDVLTASDSQLAGGGVVLTLSNSSESPVRIDALPLRMARGEAEVDAAAAGLELPLELAAGAETSFEVSPVEPLPGEGEAEVLVDLSSVVPLPDPEAILALTLDERISQQGEQDVRVITTAVKLAGGGDPVSGVLIEFEGAEEIVQVDAENMQARAAVPVPLVDVLLRRGSSEYRFRQTVLRASGEQQDDQWRTHDNPVLVVPVD